MTDNEIIMALECCHGHRIPDCDNCPNEKTCNEIDVLNSVIDLINRQKAEIERLQSMCQALSKCRDDALREGVKAVKKAKAETIKEFAQRLKGKIWHSPECQYVGSITPDYIDNLVKEMTEGANG